MSETGSGNHGVRPWLREPLLHFLVIGAAIFAATDWLNPESRFDSRHIEVTEEVMLEFMQYRNQSFSDSARDRLRKTLRSMSPEDRETLIEDFIREEVLHREALSIGLDQSDYVIRRRLAQTMEYILRGTPEQDLPAPSRETLESYFNTHRDRYSAPARVSLTHLYFDASADETTARVRAERALSLLEAGSKTVPSDQDLGDRFPYFRDYVDETSELIESHLGSEIATAAFTNPYTDAWQGPYRSRGGFHLLRLSRRTPPQTAEFSVIEEAVLADWRREETERRLEERVQSLIREYRIDRASDMVSPP